MAAALLAPPADAQSRQIQSLERRTDRLERDIQDLERELDAARSAAGGGGGLASEHAASIEVRLGALEEQLQRLTGQVERTQHDVRLLRDRMEQLSADVDFRLSALERERGVGPSAAADDRQGPRTAPVEPDTDETARQTAVPARTEEPAQAEPFLVPDESGEQVAAIESVDPSTLYKRGRDYLFGDNYAAAEQTFEQFLEQFPGHQLAPNALYWLGESHYVRENYTEAADAFLSGYQRYGDSSKGPASLLKLGISLSAMGQKDQACATFDEFDNQYPDAEEALKRRIAQAKQDTDCG